MNIRLKGIGANITSRQTGRYTPPIILRIRKLLLKYHSSLSSCSNKMNIKTEEGE